MAAATAMGDQGAFPVVPTPTPPDPEPSNPEKIGVTSPNLTGGFDWLYHGDSSFDEMLETIHSTGIAIAKPRKASFMATQAI